MTDQPKEPLTPPLPHDDGYHAIPEIQPIAEDDCGDPADDAMKRQSSVNTRRDHDRGADDAAG